MEKRTLDYEYLAERIGAVTISWSNLEAQLKNLLYDLVIYKSAAIEGDDDSFQVLVVLLGNMEMRQALANVKALAHMVNDPPDFYDRAEQLLNWIDHELRGERNRYTHDLWRIWGPIIHRIKSGAIVRRKSGSGDRALYPHASKKYLGTMEIRKFGNDIDDAIKQVQQLGDEIRAKLNEIRPQKELPAA